MEDEDREHSFFIKLKEGWTTNVPKPLSKNNVTIVYKGSSITLDKIMYLNKKKKEQKQSLTQQAPPIKGKINVLKRM